MKKIPVKSIERFCRYRQILLGLRGEGKEFVFSHQLAERINSSATQVRRDLMQIELTGSPQKGYPIDMLVKEIENIIDSKQQQNAVLVGVGNLGNAILSYFTKRRPKLIIVASFDTDHDKVNTAVSGCQTYDVQDLKTIIKERNATIGIITVPGDHAQGVADKMIDAGIKGIVNFAPTHVKVPNGVFIENIDITVSIEKTAYFAREINQNL